MEALKTMSLADRKIVCAMIRINAIELVSRHQSMELVRPWLNVMDM